MHRVTRVVPCEDSWKSPVSSTVKGVTKGCKVTRLTPQSMIADRAGQGIPAKANTGCTFFMHAPILLLTLQEFLFIPVCESLVLSHGLSIYIT